MAFVSEPANLWCEGNFATTTQSDCGTSGSMSFGSFFRLSAKTLETLRRDPST